MKADNKTENTMPFY